MIGISAKTVGKKEYNKLNYSVNGKKLATLHQKKITAFNKNNTASKEHFNNNSERVNF